MRRLKKYCKKNRIPFTNVNGDITIDCSTKNNIRPPNSITIHHGSLYFIGKGIVTVPKRIRILDGGLGIIDTSVTHLPDDIYVRYRLDLTNSPITHLPEGLKLSGIALQGTKVNHLPSDIDVLGVWTIDKHLSDKVPEGAKIGGKSRW